MGIDVTETIKGQQYRLIKLDPMQGGRLATRVAQQLAGALDDVETIKGLIAGYAGAKEGGAGGDNPLDMLNDQPRLLAAMAGGVAKINAEALYDCALQCVQGGRLFASSKLHDDHAMNSWFSDHPDHLLLVLAWALKVNCAGFFGLGGKA